MKKATLILAGIILFISCKNAPKDTAADNGGVIVARNFSDQNASKLKPAMRQVDPGNDTLVLDTVSVH